MTKPTLPELLARVEEIQAWSQDHGHVTYFANDQVCALLLTIDALRDLVGRMASHLEAANRGDACKRCAGLIAEAEAAQAGKETKE